eukprot:g18220.t1
MPDTTIRQLKQQLKAIQACEDEFTRSVSRVDLVVDGTKLCDDGQTVTQAGLSPDTEVQVLFTIHTIECSSKKDSGYDLMDLAIVHIPSSATKINYGAFQDCTLVASVIIPDSVTLIGIRAFSGCSSLAHVTIPNSVTSIGEFSFFACSSLVSLTIPNSETSCAKLENHETYSAVKVAIGSPPQMFSLVADTGSNSCISNASTGHLQGQKGPASMIMSFGSGEIAAQIASDEVRVGRIKAYMDKGLLLMA